MVSGETARRYGSCLGRGVEFHRGFSSPGASPTGVTPVRVRRGTCPETGASTMTVEPPLRDDLFGHSDEELASAYADVSVDDLAAEAMFVYGVSKDVAEAKVEKNPQRVRADIARYWAQ